MISDHNRIIRDSLRAHGGSEVKHTGDGFMASFASSDEAVSSAIAIQHAFATHNTQHPEESMYVRIGLHGGEPIERGGDLFGSTIQMAARLCAKCEPEQILASSIVRDLCERSDFLFENAGRIEVKGFDTPVEVHTVSRINARLN
jgi:class 3 adenylate cyclase